MISINLAQEQGKAIELLENYNQGDFSYVYKGKVGIKLQFETTGDPEQAAKKAKELIKEQPWGTVLYFNVMVG
jgi:hypothetical protein